ncbi:Mediator complex subunit 7 [Fasciola gigantica]|uniref:Mediator of RNA polymerase II transcription subunit 7 n=1 Tax=Fasciola gigantica TaxID=46835 RepID=A0A504Z1E8_FASGI|nr:Mediator complex subunit 7 [Fasciola gigantica]
MSTEKSKNNDTAHVSLFPSPPWQLVNRHQSASGASQETHIRPPTPPGQNVYRMFGNLYNLDDAILRSLESQGVRRVYPQTYNRKRELRKINFSILANYLDLLDIITRDPSSPKRTERLDNLAILFINMHHLVNEYRQHQARDLLREILSYQASNDFSSFSASLSNLMTILFLFCFDTCMHSANFHRPLFRLIFQVSIASQTVSKAELYTTRADDLLRNAGHELLVPGQPSVTFSMPGVSTNCVDTVRSGLVELGPSLAPLLQTVLDETMGTDPTGRRMQPTSGVSSSSRLATNLLDHSGPSSALDCLTSDPFMDGMSADDPASHVDPSLWQFLSECQPDYTSFPDASG